MTGKKKAEEKEEKKSGKEEGSNIKLQKLEAISQIENLKVAAQNYKQNKNFDDAIICADQIIRIAIKYNLSFYIREQEDFINNIARNVEQEFIVSQIKEFTTWIYKRYDDLANSDAIIQAHELVESLKNRYKDLPYFDSIPEVQDLIKKDIKEWAKYTSSYP